ncbi:zinc ribbon domain-containing protein (plasmid) [Paracoccus liaowanqingii]|uniref:Zinc ribbon domain-containing protein n=1 Tax=Paracoccus liaowanqingii TaxID=2560053 RepID=A0A4Y5SR93_9RHOB|nr:zinc ribbon domain-containing protein [Paracoccus liaowanqingii]QDA35869.1 zinc ribbon domain-containing protein [Paracoccus liaowanqingii]
MPSYDYRCPTCGPFEARASMADYAQPGCCPTCRSTSPRVLLSAPLVANMDGNRRRAFATNERSADSPKRSSHGPGCSCCSGSRKKPSSTLYRPDGSKSFPTKRPWMISH